MAKNWLENVGNKDLISNWIRSKLSKLLFHDVLDFFSIKFSLFQSQISKSEFNSRIDAFLTWANCVESRNFHVHIRSIYRNNVIIFVFNIHKLFTQNSQLLNNFNITFFSLHIFDGFNCFLIYCKFQNFAKKHHQSKRTSKEINWTHLMM